MEHSDRETRLMPYWRLLFCFIAILSIYPAAEIEAKHYKERYKQLRSMETGEKWDFHPGWYYVAFHRDYSGGRNFLNPKFDVSKSNVGTLTVKRAEELVLEKEASKRLDEQISAMDSVLTEETLRTVERSIDQAYSDYKPAFDSLKSNISEFLYCKEVLGCDEMFKRSLPLREELEMLDEEIKYIHKTGLDNQLEQGKRDIAYNEIKNKLTELSGKSHSLAMLAKVYYEIFH